MSFLLILKIAGIILLCILGILELILAVPVRYRAEGCFKDGRTAFKAEVHWLLHFADLKAEYKDGRAQGVIKILSFRVKEFVHVKSQSGNASAAESEDSEEAACAVSGAPETIPLSTWYNDFEAEDDTGAETADHETSEPGNAAGMVSEARENVNAAEEPSPESITSYGKVTEKVRRVYELISEQAASEAVRRVIRRVMAILKAISPRKGKGYAAFGTGDPYATCRILQVLAFFYPVYGKVIEIIPDLTEQKLEGEMSVKGRIYSGQVLFYAALIYFDKTAKKLYSDIREV